MQAHQAWRHQHPLLAEQLYAELVTAGGGDAVASGASVPIEGMEVIALEVSVAGKSEDQLAAGLDHLNGPSIRLRSAEADAEAVIAAIAVGGEAANRRRVRVEARYG